MPWQPSYGNVFLHLTPWVLASLDIRSPLQRFWKFTKQGVYSAYHRAISPKHSRERRDRRELGQHIERQKESWAWLFLSQTRSSRSPSPELLKAPYPAHRRCKWDPRLCISISTQVKSTPPVSSRKVGLQSPQFTNPLSFWHTEVSSQEWQIRFSYEKGLGQQPTHKADQVWETEAQKEKEIAEGESWTQIPK